MGASPEKSDIFELIQRLPSAMALVWACARLLLTMILCIAVWRHAGLEKPVGRLLQSASQWAADQLIDPVEVVVLQPSSENPNIRVPTKSLARVTIHASEQSHQNFALLMPLILLTALPFKRFAATLPHMLLATFFMGLFAILLIVTKSYILFNSYLESGVSAPDLMRERLILLPTNYLILPAVALFLSGLAISGISRFFLVPRSAKREEALAEKLDSPPKVPYKVKAKAGRNDPCPCGSGRKFKKCCGKSPSR